MLDILFCKLEVSLYIYNSDAIDIIKIFECRKNRNYNKRNHNLIKTYGQDMAIDIFRSNKTVLCSSIRVIGRHNLLMAVYLL